MAGLLCVGASALVAQPLTHSVYFKLKHAEGSAEALHFYREAMKLATIPGVEDFAWLEEFSPKNDFTYGLTMEFANQAAYDAYNVHPLHVSFVNDVWIPNVADFMEIDTVPSSLEPWQELLDPELSQWEVWTGKPVEALNSEAQELMAGTDWKPGEAIGLSDPFGIYSVDTDASGDLVLGITGKVFAGLTTKASFENYHLTMLFKWGEQKWAPREEKKRDSGILYHCFGDHGVMWKVWKRSLELQVQEGDIGDLFQLGGLSSLTRRTENHVWDVNAPASRKKSRVIRSEDMESPHGEWTRIDLYVIEDQAIHVVNGKVVMALKDAQSYDGRSLTSGPLQLQSEGAECYYKDIRIQSINTFPADVRAQAGF